MLKKPASARLLGSLDGSVTQKPFFSRYSNPPENLSFKIEVLGIKKNKGKERARKIWILSRSLLVSPSSSKTLVRLLAPSFYSKGKTMRSLRGRKRKRNKIESENSAFRQIPILLFFALESFLKILSGPSKFEPNAFGCALIHPLFVRPGEPTRKKSNQISSLQS